MRPLTPTAGGKRWKSRNSAIRNVRTHQFKERFAQLPAKIQDAAKDAYRLFLSDPYSPQLRNHELHDGNKGRHRKASRAVSVTRRYRAIYTIDGDTYVWYWIGSHEDYNDFIG